MYLDQPPNIDCQDLVREKGYDNLVQSAYLQDQVIQKLDNEDDNILALANPFQVISQISDSICFCQKQKRDGFAPDTVYTAKDNNGDPVESRICEEWNKNT